MVDPREETTLWLLRGSILSAVDHVLEPLKLEDRARLLEKQKPRKSRVTKPGDVLTRDMLAPEQGGRLRALATRPVDASRSAERALRRAAGRRPWRRRE